MLGRRLGPAAVTAAVALSASLVPASDAGRARSTACVPAWKLVLRQPGMGLSGVAAVSSRDAWAVGHAAGKPLVMHWDGASWTAVSVPAVEGGLVDVDAVSARDVWAVGGYDSPRSRSETLVMHWNGSRWSVLPTPAVHGDGLELVSVSARSKRDVWAVGSTDWSTIAPPLTQHWDGRRWTLKPLPRPPSAVDELNGVAAASASAAWAVGLWPGHEETQVIYRWNGTRWRRSPAKTNLGVDEEGNAHNWLDGVDARSPADVWAVGGNLGWPLIEHWNGHGWRIVPSAGTGRLYAVTAVTSRNAWAVGTWPDRRVEHTRPLIEHWNGRVWRRVRNPRLIGGLYDVDSASTSDVWAVGSRYEPAPADSSAVIEHYGC